VTGDASGRAPQDPPAVPPAAKQEQTDFNGTRETRAYERLVGVLEVAGYDVRPSGPRKAQAQCPAHDDGEPSLSLAGIDDSVLVYCHAGCKTTDVVKALGLRMADLFDSERGTKYQYVRSDGSPERTVTRSPDKKFRQKNAPKGEASVLFRLPQVIGAVECGLPVYVVEGEKDVLALESLGAIATTAPMGSSNWQRVDASPLYDADVIVVPDQDPAGERWAEQVRDSLNGKAASLRFCRAASGKDAADHVAAGHGLDDFVHVKVEPTRLDIGNTFEAAEWLRQEVGRQGTPLAGLFRRGGELVHTPRIDEDGYVPLLDDEHSEDGPAQVRPVDAARLRSWVTFKYPCVKWSATTEDWLPAAFPHDSATLVVNAVELAEALLPLAGVTHTPMLRKDGSVLWEEGYDAASARLYLPDRGMKLAEVPDVPTGAQVQDAYDLISRMIQDFPFNTEHDEANYVALLFTPLLRVLVPPPYPLGLIHAHQPGSGKGYLAMILRTLHGGALRTLPESNAEFRKQITSILSVTTAPVVQFDNVHKLASAAFDALLTTEVWSDRPLGVTADFTGQNDRLWIATGNNVAIGGDLLRRVRWVSIDPNVPNPEQRTDFAIEDLPSWVRKNRGELLAALLTLLRAWVVDGKPLGREVGSDSFANWTRTVQGVLAVAGWSGTVGHVETVQHESNDDDAEWGVFLAEARRLFGDQPWPVRELLEHLDLDLDAMPADMSVHSAKSAGMWLKNRKGRWAGGYALRAGGDKNGTTLWRVHQE
jgi:hypothetical protein